MRPHKSLDPRARPPDIIQEAYKYFQKNQSASDGFRLVNLNDARIHQTAVITKTAIARASLALQEDLVSDQDEPRSSGQDCPVFEHEDIPGLLIVPSLLSPIMQTSLLSRLLHRDLSDPRHMTNVHFHHSLPQDGKQSFFSIRKDGPPIKPLDKLKHKAIAFDTFMNKKLRWATLGGQYDWSSKVYPPGPAPTFPPDIAGFLNALFPKMKAEAAILNLYSPGDVLSMHRDVAEDSDRGLISISIGCDAIFLIGLESDVPEQATVPLAIKLQSGDAVFMGGKSRFAWHGVPKIIPDTCPEYLREWPAADASLPPNEYEHWRGWMARKRVNLNVRQMWD